jgi:hypothetical protein
LFESEFSLLVNFKREAMGLFHLGPVQLELRHGSPAGVVIPSVGEQDTTDVCKKAGNWGFVLHPACAKEAEDG